jgi:hypothetical protein
MSNAVAEIAEKIQTLSATEKNDLLRLLLQEIVRRVKAIRNGEAAIKALQEEWQE